MAIKLAIRHFIDEINGRRLIIYTDHLPICGSWKNLNLQQHDAVALNAINEIAQWTTDIRHKPGKELELELATFEALRFCPSGR